MRRFLPLLFLATAACTAERRTLLDPRNPSEMAVSRTSSAEMSVEDARALLVRAGVERSVPDSAAQGSLEDALAILKSDELAL